MTGLRFVGWESPFRSTSSSKRAKPPTPGVSPDTPPPSSPHVFVRGDGGGGNPEIIIGGGRRAGVKMISFFSLHSLLASMFHGRPVPIPLVEGENRGQVLFVQRLEPLNARTPASAPVPPARSLGAFPRVTLGHVRADQHLRVAVASSAAAAPPAAVFAASPSDCLPVQNGCLPDTPAPAPA